MSQTKIEWADKVWNPITGCSPVSEGCRNCYAKRMACRLQGRYGYPRGWASGEPEGNPFKVTFHPDKFDEPLHWKKPCRIFVCSMGDLFHKDVSTGFLIEIFRTMIKNPQHIYLVLTKRPKKMSDFLSAGLIMDKPFIWLGVSVENQRTADERIPILLQIPAAKRFVSVEPMLENINLYLDEKKLDCGGCSATPVRGQPYCPGHYVPELDWVICGGETGPGARPLHPDWARSLSDQCQAAGVPFFFKSWGEWAPHKRLAREGTNTGAGIFLKPDGSMGCQGDWWEGKAQAMDKVGKKKAGRLLDGREWNEYPK